MGLNHKCAPGHVATKCWLCIGLACQQGVLIAAVRFGIIAVVDAWEITVNPLLAFLPLELRNHQLGLMAVMMVLPD